LAGTVLFALVLLFSSIALKPWARVDAKAGEIIDQEFLQNLIDAPDVEKAINDDFAFTKEDVAANFTNWGLSSKDEVPISLGTPYKLCYMEKDYLEKYQQTGNFSSAISNRYIWVVPYLDKNGKVAVTSHVEFLDGSWQVTLLGLSLPKKDVAFSCDKEKIIEFLEQNNINNVEIFKHVRLSNPRLDAIYVKSGTEEYIIPMGFRPDKVKEIKLNSLYSLEEFMSLVKEYSAEHSSASKRW